MSRARTNANNWAADITAVTAGTGVTVTNGTGPIPTVAIDSTVATLDGSQTLTNKTLTSPVITTPTLTLDSNTTTTNGRIAWVQASDKLVVGDGTIAVEFAPSTLLTSAQTASYTLALSDKDRLVEVSNAGATTLTVPTNASVAFPIGSQVNLLQTGAGQVTVAGTAGVTVNATPGLKLRTQWSSATLVKRGEDTWVLVGDLSA